MPPGSPLYRLVALRHDARGFIRVADQDLPANGQGMPRSTPGGFVSFGRVGTVGAMAVPDARHRYLLIWDRVPATNGRLVDRGLDAPSQRPTLWM